MFFSFVPNPADRSLRLFLLLLFPLTYLLWLLVWLGGGLAAVPAAPVLNMLLPGLVAVGVTRWVARQPVVATLGLRPRLSRGRWRYLLAALVLPALCLAAAIGLSALVLPAGVVPDVAAGLHRALSGLGLATGRPATDALVLVLMNNGLGVLLNAPLFLGEEIGWRAFLFPRLEARLGTHRALLAVGTLWGLWHAGAILQGYNYPQHPVAGVALFVVFCLALSVIFQYFYQRGGSVWGAVLAHGALNSAPKTLQFFFNPGPNYHDLLHGYVGLLALLPLSLAAFWCYRRLHIVAAPAAAVPADRLQVA